MQIADMLNQYNRNIANGIEIPGGSQGIRQILSSLQEMSVGNVFEGSILQIENNAVTLGLPDGQAIQARLDPGVSVRAGESMFFQVRSNNGLQIEIRPFSGETGSNLALFQALTAANLQVCGRTVTMVNAMMELSMPIDKQSLTNMARLVMGKEQTDASSIVQMVKLGIPVTEEMAAQFENYKSDQYAISGQLESMMEQLPSQLSSKNLSPKELLGLNSQILRLFLEGGAPEKDGSVTIKTGQQTENAEVLPKNRDIASDQAISGQTTDKPEKTVLAMDPIEFPKMPQKLETEGNAVIQKEGMPTQNLDSASSLMKTPADLPLKTDEKGNMPISPKMEEPLPSLPDSLKNLLTKEELQQLSAYMKKIPEFSKNPLLFQEGVLKADVSVRKLFQFFDQALLSKNPFSRHALCELISSKEYRSLARSLLRQQWLLQPEELTAGHKVSELYERLDRQLSHIEKILKSFGQNTGQLSDLSGNIKSNISFMNHLNQTFSYVQIPLKFSEGTAHSDLYVYTGHRKKQEKDDDLTAFLHLDLKHLGSADVSIRLQKKNVAANFYLAEDRSYQLVLDHLDLLEKQLAKRGYQARIQVSNQQEKTNFMEDILKQGTPSAGGIVHRYSFDVRA